MGSQGLGVVGPRGNGALRYPYLRITGHWGCGALGSWGLGLRALAHEAFGLRGLRATGPWSHWALLSWGLGVTWSGLNNLKMGLPNVKCDQQKCACPCQKMSVNVDVFMCPQDNFLDGTDCGVLQRA